MADRAAARRRELVRCAYEVFSTKGYRTSGVADIVREAGVSHGTFYNYYDSKRHILDGVLDYAVELLLTGVIEEDQPHEAATLDELAEQFRAMLGRLFVLVDAQPGLVQFTMLDAAAIDDELVGRLLELISSFGVLATAYLENGVERGFLPSDLDAKIAGEGLLSLMMSAVIPSLRGPVTAEARTRHIDALVGLAFGGIVARKGSP
jgi:AcrR family transcriptional regulator